MKNVDNVLNYRDSELNARIAREILNATRPLFLDAMMS